MVDEELHALTDAFPFLRIFLAPFVCVLVLLESINHLADDVLPLCIAFVFSVLLNNAARCTAVWPLLRFQKARRWLAIILAKRVSKDHTSSYDTSAYPSWHLAFHAFSFHAGVLFISSVFLAKVFVLNAKSWQSRKIICLCFNSAHSMISFATKKRLWKILICQTF